MMRSAFWACLFLAIGIQTAAGQGLSALLDRVPADALDHEGERADVLRFVDLQAAAHAMEAALTPEQRNTLDEFQAQQLLIARIAQSRTLDGAYLSAGGSGLAYLPAYFGFDWQDINALARTGGEAIGPLILTGGPALNDATALDAALTGREWDPYAAAERGNSTVWWRFEDGTTDPGRSDPADPFYGVLGGASRVSIVDGVLIGAMDWATLEAWLASAGGDAATLSQSADLSALAAAVEAPAAGAAVLLQAHVRDQPYGSDYLVKIEVGDSGFAERQVMVEDYMAAQVAASGIPPYQGVAIADQQDGANAIGIIALAYTDRVDAEVAASSVPTAVASGLTLRGQPFADLLPYEVTSDVFEGPNSDRYVARIIFSEPTAADNRDSVGGPFAMLMRVIDRGDIAGLLATTN